MDAQACVDFGDGAVLGLDLFRFSLDYWLGEANSITDPCYSIHQDQGAHAEVVSEQASNRRRITSQAVPGAYAIKRGTGHSGNNAPGKQHGRPDVTPPLWTMRTEERANDNHGHQSVEELRKGQQDARHTDERIK